MDTANPVPGRLAIATKWLLIAIAATTVVPLRQEFQATLGIAVPGHCQTRALLVRVRFVRATWLRARDPVRVTSVVVRVVRHATGAIPRGAIDTPLPTRQFRGETPLPSWIGAAKDDCRVAWLLLLSRCRDDRMLGMTLLLVHQCHGNYHSEDGSATTTICPTTTERAIPAPPVATL